MAEFVHVFAEPVFLDGRPYTARVAGRQAGHIWEGWIEFAATDESDVRRGPRETTQPDRNALVYWATGLSVTYLEGAFQRALAPQVRRGAAPPPSPRFDSPAPRPFTDPMAGEGAVLNPFSVGAKGEELLRRELGALRGWHLRNIIRAYQLAHDETELETLTEPELIELIVHGVQTA